MSGWTQYLYTSIFGPEKTLFVTEQELQEAKRNLRKTGRSVCHEDFFKWVEDNNSGTYENSHLMDMAASYGDLKVLKWLYETGMSQYTQNALNWAAYRGDINIVRWLCENLEFDLESPILWAEYNNNMEVAEYLKNI